MVTTTTTSAIDVAVDTLAYIKAHPDEWKQNGWTFCFAGHFARLDPEVTTELVGYENGCNCCSQLAITDGEGVSYRVGEWFHSRLRGLAQDTYALTWQENTIEQLESGVIALKEGRNVEDAVVAARPRWNGEQQ